MNATRSSRGQAVAVAAVAVGLVTVLAFGAAGVLGGQAGSSPSPAPSSPSAPSTPAPSVPIDPTPSVPASPAPSDAPAGGLKVVLDIATPHDVAVDIDDETGSLVKAISGRAGDGMSVRWNVIQVENVDDHTLRLTWVGLAVDDEVEMTISTVDGGIRIDVAQAGPYPNSDALGGDRVLILSFDAPVSADDVVTAIEYHAL